jgi:hypothetical protein
MSGPKIQSVLQSLQTQYFKICNETSKICSHIYIYNLTWRNQKGEVWTKIYCKWKPIMPTRNLWEDDPWENHEPNWTYMWYISSYLWEKSYYWLFWVMYAWASSTCLLYVAQQTSCKIYVCKIIKGSMLFPNISNPNYFWIFI